MGLSSHFYTMQCQWRQRKAIRIPKNVSRSSYEGRKSNKFRQTKFVNDSTSFCYIIQVCARVLHSGVLFKSFLYSEFYTKFISKNILIMRMLIESPKSPPVIRHPCLSFIVSACRSSSYLAQSTPFPFGPFIVFVRRRLNMGKAPSFVIPVRRLLSRRYGN